ncbi:MAG: MFS transporter [Chloroflexota bacterium]
MSTPEPPVAHEDRRGLVRAGSVAFFLVGWSIVLMPALIRDVQAHFRADDATMGGAYLFDSIAYIAGSIGIGVLTARGLRRPGLTSGGLLLALGLVLCALSPAWAGFVVGFTIFGAGCGMLDSGVNALFLDLHPRDAARPLSRLHLWLALGAFIGPVTTGRLVEAGVPWQAVLLGTAGAAAAIAGALALHAMPSGRRPRTAADGHAGSAPGRRLRSAGASLYLPLAVLALGLGCYIAMEIGLSSWLVRYLEEADLGLATLSLSLFWGALAAGRAGATVLTRRFTPRAIAVGASLACAGAIAGAVVMPDLGARMVCFALAGLAAGPIYPMVMAVGGDLYPGRANLVGSILASIGVAGAIVYPPLMGVISETAGLAAAVVGAAILAAATAPLVLAAVALGRRRATPQPGIG